MLYPPILKSSQPVFSINNDSFVVPFDLATVANPDDIDTIEVLVAQQSNNKSIMKSPDQEVTFSASSLQVTVLKSWFTTSLWKAGFLYKVQLRFKNSSEHSEWSNVMIVKPITPPTLQVSNSQSKAMTTSTSIELVSSLTPTFFGYCSNLASNKEIEEFYRFYLYTGTTLLDDTGWLEHVNDKQDTGYFETILQQHHTYSVVYEIKTHNGYLAQSSPYTFISIQSTIGDLEHVNFTAQANSDEACIETLIQTNELLDGNYVIARTSNKSHFQKFEDIHYLYYLAHSIEHATVVFRDYTVESGVTYQYSLQHITTSGVRTNALLTAEISVDFEDMFLYHDDLQLRIRYNNNVSSFKHTVLRSKQDTLGDKYPHLLQNGHAYYAEFPISGLITYQDNTSNFFTIQTDGVYYKNELIVETAKFEKRAGGSHGHSTPTSRSEQFDHRSGYPFGDARIKERYAYSDDEIATEGRRLLDTNYEVESQSSNNPTPSTAAIAAHVDYTISTDLTHNNIYIERKFREKVEEFLNNFEYKLFKSPTEGNIVVSLMNVQLKPNETVGRALYEFSATAYEVLENTLSELDTYGVLTIGEPVTISDAIGTIKDFGQVIMYPGKTWIANPDKNSSTRLPNGFIDQAERNAKGVHYICDIVSVDKIWVEPYPVEILEIEKNNPIAGKTKKNYESWIQLSGRLPIRLGYGETSENASLTGGNKRQELLLPMSRVHTVKFPDTVTYLSGSFPYPVVVNYECTLKVTSVEEEQEVSSPAAECRFGQIAGIYDAGTDLYAVIVQKIKDETGIKKQNEDGSWIGADDKEYALESTGLNSIDIEAEKGTEIHLGLNESTYTVYKIGYNTYNGSEYEIRFESNQIFFPDILAHSKYFHLETTAYVIVNFTYWIEIYTFLKPQLNLLSANASGSGESGDTP